MAAFDTAIGAAKLEAFGSAIPAANFLSDGSTVSPTISCALYTAIFLSVVAAIKLSFI